MQKEETHHAPDGREFRRQRFVVSLLHEDLIQDDFWRRFPVITVPHSKSHTIAEACAFQHIESNIAAANKYDFTVKDEFENPFVAADCEVIAKDDHHDVRD